MPPEITDLPENVVNAILMPLSLRDAVRTSILSKKWRYKWCKLPQLTLDDELWKTTNNLLSPSIKFTAIMYNILPLHSGPITNFQPHLALEDLRLDYGSLQFLTAVVSRRLSSTLNNLKRLYVSLDELTDLSCALCLIRSSPCLQHLEIEVSIESDNKVNEVSAGFSDVTLNSLKTVKFTGIIGTKLDMVLIKLVLAKSPMLVKMLIEPDLQWVDKEKGVKIRAELTTFQRASRKAEVECRLERK